ncbi:hypothetical protein [Candidatus Nitrospira bockiana]
MLCFAIANKRMIAFDYQSYPRIAEPHDYGILGGVERLFIYQVDGGSKSGRLPDWRLVDVAGITRLRVLDEMFPGGRAVPSGQHKQWDHLFRRVSPAPG